MNSAHDKRSTSRKLVGAFITGAALLLAAEAALVLLLQLYLRDLGASALVISLSGSLAWIGAFIAGPFWGAMADRASARCLLVAVLLGSAVATSSLALLLAAPAVLALGTARRFLANGLPPIGMKMISSASRPARRGRNLSYLSAARAAGFAVGGILGGVLLERVGYRGAFLVVALMPLAALPVLSWVPRRGGDSVRSSVRHFTMGAVRRSPFALLYTAAMLRQLATTGVAALAFVYMAEYAISGETMGWISSINPTIGAVGTLVFGRLVDRTDRRIVILFGFAVTVLYPLVYAFATRPAGFALAAIPLGLSFSSYYVGTTSAIAELVPLDQQGRMFGLLDSSRALGGLVGPILAGTLVTALGYRPMFLVMSGVAGLAVVLIGLAMRRLRSPVFD